MRQCTPAQISDTCLNILKKYTTYNNDWLQQNTLSGMLKKVIHKRMIVILRKNPKRRAFLIGDATSCGTRGGRGGSSTNPPAGSSAAATSSTCDNRGRSRRRKAVGPGKAKEDVA